MTREARLMSGIIFITVPTIQYGDIPNWGYRYFVAHVAQIRGGNAQANAVNSTDLVWSRLVRDQEVDGSKSIRPTTLNQSNNWS